MTDDIDYSRDKLSPDQLDKLNKRHRQGAFVRTGASLFMWLFAFVAYLVDGIQKNHLIGVSFCVAYLILINPPSLWILKHITRVKIYQSFSALINLLEIIGYTAVIYFAGGVTSLHVTPIYCALIAYVGMVGQSRLPFSIATFCSVSLGLMVGLEYFGYLPHQYPDRVLSLPGIYQLTIVTANICLLYVMAFIVSYTGGLLRRNKRRLRKQNEELKSSREELQLATKELEEKNVKLKTAVDQARESDRMKSEFLANMSHELRTPLNHIIGFTELVADKKCGELNQVQEEYLNDALHSSKHLLSLINDVLDLSKVEAGKLELQLSEVNLKMILKNILIMFTEKIMKHHIQLSSQIDGIPEVITADERKLKQILYNLLSNAVKFTRDGGEIRLTAELTDNSLLIDDCNDKEALDQNPGAMSQAISASHRYIKISVIDTGIGIQPENIERIFNVFEQIETSYSRKYQGTGLGLPLTKRLVELHGGKMWAESEGEGKGSAFLFAIPTDLKTIEE